MPKRSLPGKGGLICAAMIVKDEIAGIRAALDSLAPVVDEVVVLDTGSQDGTIQAVEETAGAWLEAGGPPLRLFHEPWHDDFSRARNLVAENTPEKTEWIVVLDGDEVLEPGDLQETLSGAPDEADGAAALVIAGSDDEAGEERCLSIRAYRKSRGRWRYPVHNKLEGVTEVLPTTAVVRTSYKGRVAAKLKRSLPLLKNLHEQDPTDPHAPFFLARSYMSAMDWPEVIRWCELCKQLCPEDPPYASFWLWYAKAKMALDGPEAARAVVEEGLSHHDGFPDLWHYRMSLDAAFWIIAAADPGQYLFVSSRSAAVLSEPEKIKAACEALGMPLRLNISRQGDTQDVPHAKQDVSSR